MSIFTPPEERRRLEKRARMQNIGRTLGRAAREELEIIAAALEADPHSEPEPTQRFDQMTAEEREYIAHYFGL